MDKRAFILFCCGFGFSVSTAFAEPLRFPSPERFTPDAVSSMTRAASGRLAPVYGPLAEWLVEEFDLAEKEGIGVDLGGGPGTLVLELGRRTETMHWVNADINPHFFPGFYAAVQEAGLEGRCSAIFADATLLPFRDEYADTIVSRGSFPFWDDKRQGFSEVYRVLRPGGVAVIGRGFSESLPVETARAIRGGQGKRKKRPQAQKPKADGKGKGFPKYDVAETEAELREIMSQLGIADHRIFRPKPDGAGEVNYGIWAIFRKPEKAVGSE